MELKCECDGTLVPATLRNFDLSAYAGINVFLAVAPGYRCSKCGLETVDGTVINGVLERLALEVAKVPQRLPADHARFLRKHLRLSQQALADRLCVDRVTVAKWESGENVISSQHDLALRAIVIGHLLRSSTGVRPEDVADAIDRARKEAPLKMPPPFILQDHLDKLRSDPKWH
ncbi:helix-turn-helix domain-containing protein [Sorangium sp. So ce854]|uniref:helix-turn-helix domain-containing protein n=1 Tax=Sorangium sp. So ce854 TaxID=3133322 RepID=UPI003F622581